MPFISSLINKPVGVHFLLPVLLFCSVLNVRAQDWSFAIGPGITAYSGDVNNQQVGPLGLALNGEAWYRLTDHWQIKSGLSFYGIKGNDADTLRMRSFKANNFELYTSGMYYLKKGFLTPFVYAGIGATTNNPMGASRYGYWDLRDTQPEGESIDKVVGFVPFGIGLEYEITPVLALIFDLSLRYTFSDQLDAVSKPETNVEELSPTAINYYEAISDGVARRVDERQPLLGGSPNARDMYSMFFVKVKFTPSTALFGCVEPYKYAQPKRSNRRKRNFSPL